MEFLNDLEKDKLQSFIADEVMMEAVKKVMLAVIYNQGTINPGEKTSPTKNAFLALVFKTIRGEAIAKNEQLGEDLRAMAYGVNYLEAGFAQLLKLNSKVPNGETPAGNPAI